MPKFSVNQGSGFVGIVQGFYKDRALRDSAGILCGFRGAVRCSRSLVFRMSGT